MASLAFGQNWRDIASWNNLSDRAKLKQGKNFGLCQKILEMQLYNTIKIGFYRDSF